ncbi:MAG: hypothetical protein JOZ82_10985 [Marmoricola sp.]|nr:hypothetical protein [Marmoricola sp.]
MTGRLVRAELFKLRATDTWWIFTGAILLSRITVLVVNAVFAHALLKPFATYVDLQTHGHGNQVPAYRLARFRSEWLLGHSSITQAATLSTSGQLIGLLLVALLGIVMVTSEFQQQTATSTFLTNPRRTEVIQGKLGAALIVAVAAWAVSTVICVGTAAVFLATQGVGGALLHGAVLRAVLLNLAAFVIWTLFGIGFGALIRNQLIATVSATVLYLVGGAAATTLFELLNTYVLAQNWVLATQVVAPSIASTVMISPTATFAASPPQWVGAVVLVAYGVVFGVWGTRRLRDTDIA